MIAPMVAASDSGDIRAVVLIATPAWTGREVIRSQLRAQLAANPALTDTERDSTAAQRLSRIEETAVPWMRFYLNDDPLPVGRRVRAPVLILQGRTDQQVPLTRPSCSPARFVRRETRR